MSNRRRWRLRRAGAAKQTSSAVLQFHSTTIFSGPGTGMRTLYCRFVSCCASKFPRPESSLLLSFTASLTAIAALLLFSLQISFSSRNPRDKLIKTTCVAFHSKMAGIVSGLVKIEWTLYCTFLLLAWTQHYDYSPPSQYCLQLSRQK